MLFFTVTAAGGPLVSQLPEQTRRNGKEGSSLTLAVIEIAVMESRASHCFSAAAASFASRKAAVSQLLTFDFPSQRFMWCCKRQRTMDPPVGKRKDGFCSSHLSEFALLKNTLTPKGRHK